MNRSFVDILNIIGFLAVMVVIVFAVYTLFIDKPFYRASSYWNDEGTEIGDTESTGTYSTDKPADRVYIRNVSGRIDVESWNENYVQLDYRKFGPGQAPEVKTDFTGSTLTVKAVYPKAPGNFGSVDFMLKVPESLDYLEAASVSGQISVTGLDEEAEQKLSTTSAGIKTDGGGDLDISSVSGTIVFSTSGDDVSASTTSGRIEGTLKQAHSSGTIDLSSVSGRVILDVPSDFSAEVDLHSVSGSVSSELPVSVTETKRNTIKGLIGSGGTDLEISTVSGSIKITE